MYPPLQFGATAAVSAILALCLAGCAARTPVPALLAAPGVKRDARHVTRDVLAHFGSRVMELHLDEKSSELLIVREDGVEQRRLDGSETSRVPFQRNLFRASLVRSRDAKLVSAIGLAGPRDVPIVRLSDAGVLATLRGDVYVRPLVANVIGDGAAEILLPFRDGIRVYTGNGSFWGTVSAPRYASDRVVVQADASPELEIAFVSTHLAGGALDVRVVKADNRVITVWHSDRGTWLSAVPALGEDRLWGVATDGFVAWDAFGREVEHYPSEAVWYLRDVAGARTNGFTALVASGNGYRGRSIVNIYDAQHRLIYQEVFSGRSYTVVADPNDPVFYVGVRNQVIRYAVEAYEPLQESTSSGGSTCLP